MRRRTKIALVSVLVIGAASFLFLFRASARPGPLVRLSDGTTVRVYAVTYGTNHHVRYGNAFQRAVGHLPLEVLDRCVPKKWLKGMGGSSRVTTTNAALIWLQFSPGIMNQLLYTVTDTNGVGGYRSSRYEILRSTSRDEINPVELLVWPRRAEKIAINLYGLDYQPRLGSVILDNPARTGIKPFSPNAVPARERSGELELALLSLEVKSAGKTFSTPVGNWCASRAVFKVAENGAFNRDWVVQTMSFSDAGGNVRRATGRRAWNGEVFEIYSDPLFLTEGAWRIDVDLTRSTNFTKEELVVFENVPMPLKDGPEAIQFHTNLLGRALTLTPMSVARVNRGRGHSMGGPGFAIEIDGTSDDWVPKIAAIWNERGEPLRVPAHGYGPGYALARFSVSEDAEVPKFLRVQVTVQARRKFTFFAMPNVVD